MPPAINPSAFHTSFGNCQNEMAREPFEPFWQGETATTHNGAFLGGVAFFFCGTGFLFTWKVPFLKLGNSFSASPFGKPNLISADSIFCSLNHDKKARSLSFAQNISVVFFLSPLFDLSVSFFCSPSRENRPLFSPRYVPLHIKQLFPSFLSLLGQDRLWYTDLAHKNKYRIRVQFLVWKHIRGVKFTSVW